MNKKKLKIEVIGYEDQLKPLAHFLRQMEYLGNIGATRTLHLWVDGDGSARMKVNFPDIKGKIEPIDIDKEPKGGFKFFIE